MSFSFLLDDLDTSAAGFGDLTSVAVDSDVDGTVIESGIGDVVDAALPTLLLFCEAAQLSLPILGDTGLITTKKKT